MEPKTPARKPQSEDKYVVRFPDGMRDRIAEEAKKNNRSMNAEIVARLEKSFEEPIQLEGELRSFEDVERRLQQIANQLQLQSRLIKIQAKNRPFPVEEPPSPPKKTIPKK